ncbi:hypothetical protein HanIR_Chr10g0482131 [Helianthus annuus]|nr:hypothetical protein HanIR_Chr10g0482131 [Helianthus annuus]
MLWLDHTRILSRCSYTQIKEAQSLNQKQHEQLFSYQGNMCVSLAPSISPESIGHRIRDNEPLQTPMVSLQSSSVAFNHHRCHRKSTHDTTVVNMNQGHLHLRTHGWPLHGFSPSLFRFSL